MLFSSPWIHPAFIRALVGRRGELAGAMFLAGETHAPDEPSVDCLRPAFGGSPSRGSRCRGPGGHLEGEAPRIGCTTRDKRGWPGADVAHANLPCAAELAPGTWSALRLSAQAAVDGPRRRPARSPAGRVQFPTGRLLASAISSSTLQPVRLPRNATSDSISSSVSPSGRISGSSPACGAPPRS